jgi:hypothetical protein
LICAVLSFARPAVAQLDLRWEAPAECPQQEEVFERTRKVAGAALEETSGLSVEGSIAPSSGRYRLTLVVRTGDDVRQRVIVSDSCADLAGAAAVTVALMLGVDPSTVDTSAAGTGSSDSEPNTGGKSTPDERKVEQDNRVPPKPPPKQPSESQEKWSAILRAPFFSADFGPLPSPAFGAGLGAGARYGAWRALISGRISLRQTVDAPNSNGAFGAELDRWTIELDACHGFRADVFEFSPCVAVALEHLTAKGFGESVSPTKNGELWFAPGVGGVAHLYVLDSLALFASVTGYVELSRPRLVIEGVGEVARLSPVAGGVIFGAEWIL